MRYALEVRERVGRSLQAPGPRGRQRDLARAMARTPRTMRRWKAKAGKPRRPPGRPGRSLEEKAQAMEQVEEAAERLGRVPSVREAAETLSIPPRLAAETVRTYRQNREARAREAEMARRVSVQVKYRDVLWAQDEGHFGRIDGAPLLASVVRDAASTKTLAVGVGPPPSGDDIAALLWHLQKQRGELPLVLSVDNGAAQKSRQVAEYCEAEGVIVLRSLPRTPKHNPFVERAIGELRQASGLQPDTVLADEPEGIARLQEAWRRIDNHWPRRKHGYETAAAVDAVMPAWYPRVSRARFYEAARNAIEEAVRARGNARARRLAEREAIFRTLEDFGLITRTRGGKPFDRAE